MSMDNDNFDFMSELNDIHQKTLKEKEQQEKVSSNSMFEFEDDDSVLVDIPVERTVKINKEAKRKYSSNTPARSVEEYEEWVDSVHYETMTRPDGSTYEVKVTVLKPGVNPLEHMRPAYAFSTNF